MSSYEQLGERFAALDVEVQLEALQEHERETYAFDPLLADDLKQRQRQLYQQAVQATRQDRLQVRAERLQKRWARAVVALHKIQQEGQQLVEQHPGLIEIIEMAELPEPTLAAYLQPAPEPIAEEIEPQPLTMAQRMAASFNRNRQRIAERWAA